MSRIYAVGDIHGQFDKLKRLMDRVAIDYSQDTLVFLGDYIDRGPGSFEVVQYLIELQQAHPEVVLLKGNHEEMLLDYLAGHNRLFYLRNGGYQTIESYLNQQASDKNAPIPDHHLQFFNSLALYHETVQYVFVHAGLKDGVPLAQQDPADLLWTRERFIQSKYDFGKTVVFGHTPFEAPYVKNQKIGVDTGAAYGGKLTCVELPAVTFHHA